MPYFWKKTDIEKEADTFASNLLMPTDELHKRVDLCADGNGRTTRALTNWLLRLKGLCPIYIDSDNRDDYIRALQEVDKSKNYDLLQIIIIKSMIRTMAEFHKSWQ